jgi:peptidoglycan/LPS O-acetylase OafA/YrhL
MTIASLLIFALVVALGLSMAADAGRRKQPVPLKLSLTHGGLALIALGLLLARTFTGPKNIFFNAAAVVFLMALAGGLLLLMLRSDRHPPPLIVVALHATFALVAFGLLVAGVLGA